MLEHSVNTWRAGLRGHSFHAVFLLGLLLVAGGYLAALFSPRQPETVALDIGLSGMRFSLVLLALFWVQELLGKEIERKTSIIYLAYPIPRARYVLGRFTGIAVLLLTACVILGMLLWVAVFAASGNYEQAQHGALGLPFWFSLLGLWMDVVVVAAFALCIATLSTVPALPLALGAAFAIVSHSLGAVIEFLAQGAYGQKDLIDHYGVIIDIAKWIIPDLSRLDWRVWPMYAIAPTTDSLLLSTLMAVCYIGLMLGIAVSIFKKREFD